MLSSLLTVGYDYNYDPAAVAGAALFTGANLIVGLVVTVIMIVAMWKLFTKADEPGWAAIVPFYNMYVLFKISFGNGWLFLLSFVPVVNFVISIMMYFKLAKAFGKGVGFGFGLLFLAPIFLLILAFGSAEYEGV